MPTIYSSLSTASLLLLLVLSSYSQQSIFEKGKELFDRKDYSEAAKVFSHGTRRKETKTDPNIWYYLGLSYFNLKDFKNSSRAYKKAIKYDKKNGNMWNGLGLAHIQLDEMKNARKAFLKAAKYAPLNAAFKANLAYVYLKTGKYGRAQKYSKQALKIDPQNVNAYYFRGVSYLWEGNFDKAIRDADKSISLDESIANAYILKSDSLLYKYGRATEKDGDLRIPISLLRLALDTLSSCLEKCRKESHSGIKNRMDGVSAFYRYFNRNERKAKNSSNFTPIKILSKPKPGYTDQARYSNTGGVVRIAVLFGANGKIGRLMVLEGLPNGLTQKALAAARKIQFDPPRENGKPYSVVKVVQFNFRIY